MAHFLSAGAYARIIVVSLVAAALACGNSDVTIPELSVPEQPSSSVDGSVGDTAQDATPEDTADASLDSGGDGDATTEPRVPPVTDGLLMGVQGIPIPEPDQAMPFIEVGCPFAGHVELRVFEISDNGAKRDLGRFVASYEKRDGTHHIAVSSSLTIEVPEQNSLAIAPLEYRTTVTSDGTIVDTTAHTFRAHVLNPTAPIDNEVGFGIDERLTICR